MTPQQEQFQAALTAAYQDLFVQDPEYAYVSQRMTPEMLAVKMTAGLRTGAAHHAGTGIRRACRAVGIPHTQKAIRAFLRQEEPLP